jgi:hypothetical protein
MFNKSNRERGQNPGVNRGENLGVNRGQNPGVSESHEIRLRPSTKDIHINGKNMSDNFENFNSDYVRNNEKNGNNYNRNNNNNDNNHNYPDHNDNDGNNYDMRNICNHNKNNDNSKKDPKSSNNDRNNGKNKKNEKIHEKITDTDLASKEKNIRSTVNSELHDLLDKIKYGVEEADVSLQDFRDILLGVPYKDGNNVRAIMCMCISIW